MRDLSLHLLDLCQNSIQAGSGLVEVGLRLREDGHLFIRILDDGRGMDEDTLNKAYSPFGTHRTTRKVGLGIPLASNNAEMTGGSLTITSQPGKGTQLAAEFDTRHIDCPPLGDLGQTLASLILANPDRPDFVLTLASSQGEQTLDTREIKQTLGEVPINQAEVVTWLTEAIHDMTNEIFGGMS